MCNRLNRNIETGEVVVIQKKYHNENYQELEQRLFIALGGFGMKAETMGNAVFGEYVSDGEQCRREGYEIDLQETLEYQERHGKFAHKVKSL